MLVYKCDICGKELGDASKKMVWCFKVITKEDNKNIDSECSWHELCWNCKSRLSTAVKGEAMSIKGEIK